MILMELLAALFEFFLLLLIVVLENAGAFQFLDPLCSLYCFKREVFKKEVPVLGEC